MFKGIKASIVGVVVLALSFTCLSITPALASDGTTNYLFSTSGKEPDDIKNKLSALEKYIDINNNRAFNEDLARQNHESQEIIEIGRIYNEMLLSELERSKGMKSKGLLDWTRYGNWCGPGNYGKAPIDLLDKQCQIHDKCYGRRGQWNADCDLQFLYNLYNNYGRIRQISKGAASYAVAAIGLFSAKYGVHVWH